jgi:hypothetical protein
VIIGGKSVVLRKRLSIGGRRTIEAAQAQWFSSDYALALRSLDDDVSDDERARAVAPFSVQQSLLDEVANARILAYVESVDGQQPAAEWLDSVDEDEYDLLKQAVSDLEEARAKRSPSNNPHPDPESPTAA